MEVFGMTRSPDRFDEGEVVEIESSTSASAFDYLRDVTTTTTRGKANDNHNNNNNNNNTNNPNESISFLLDTSTIAAVDDGGSLASTKEQKKAFYSLHDTAVSEFLSPKRSSSRNNNNSNTNNSRNNSNSNDDVSEKYKFASRLISPKSKTKSKTNETRRSMSPFALPTLAGGSKEDGNETKQSNSNVRSNGRNIPNVKINTRRSLSSSTGKKVSTTTLVTPASGRRGVQQQQKQQQQQQHPQTPGGFWTTNTESKTFVNGLLSPFSPLLHSAIHKQSKGKTTNLTTIHDHDDDNDRDNNDNDNNNTLSLKQTIKRQRDEFMQYVSLQPCRKVSVVVRVTAVDEDAKRCIFPHFKDEILPSGGSLGLSMSPGTHNNNNNNNNDGFATPQGKIGTTSLLRTTPHSAKSSKSSVSSRLSSPTHRRDVVVVNPTAFGKYIPSRVTMETAKLVAQVANIASEDWARLYEFHHVMWPTPNKSREQNNNKNNNNNDDVVVGSPHDDDNDNTKNEDLASSYNTMDSISRAVVQDLLAEHESSLLISLGHETTCFGTTTTTSVQGGENGKPTVSSIGLWPKIMNQCAAMLETKGIVRLTMVEIIEPSGGASTKSNTSDCFRDLLAPSDKKPTTIHLRHSDMKGAVLEGLTEVEIDSMPALLEALAKSRQRRAQRRKQKARHGNTSTIGGTATAVIGTLHYWEHAVSFELNKPSNATITCVELASNQSQSGSDGKGSKNQQQHQQETLESIAHRKSAVSLGQALRQLLLQQAQGIEGLSTTELAPVISYRETTLTKVLQRSMESSKIVLIASISPLSRDYDQTVFTLNYLRRLLVKPGNTLTSPFGGRNNTGSSAHKRTPPKTAKTDNRTNPANDLDFGNNNNATPAKSVNRSVLSSPEALENKEKLKTMTNTNPKLLEQLVSDPRQRLARLFGPSPTQRKKPKPWSNVLDRMEDSQKSTRGTPTAISLNPNNDASVTLSPNSYSANSYAGPEEARQVVESPGSTQQQGQPRQSWQVDDNDDDQDNGGVGDYPISYEGENNYGDNHAEDDDDEDSDEWASEEEIERELLASARRKERSLQMEIEAMETEVYPNENFSYDDDDEEEEDVNDEKRETGEPEEPANENDHHEGIEVDLQGAQNVVYYSPEKGIAEAADRETLQEIVPEGSYYDDDDVDDQGIPEAPTDIIKNHLEEEEYYDDDGIPEAPTDIINDHLGEEFAQNEDEMGGDRIQEDDDDTLGLQPITVETVEDSESLVDAEKNHEPIFSDEEWQTEGNTGNETPVHEGTEASSLGFAADQVPLQGEDSPVVSSIGFDSNRDADDSTEDIGPQTNYDLPEAPSPRPEITKQIRVRSARSLTPVKNRPPPSPASPFRERKGFNSYASPYSVTLKTSKSKEYKELTDEREELRSTVAKLTEDLKKVSRDRDTHFQQYENEIQELYAKLDQSEKAKLELETVASTAITARTTTERDIENFEEEKEQLQRTVDSLRNDMARMSEEHEDQLYRHRAEIDDFQSKLDRARETQKEIEDIADEAVTAHKTQVEETKHLAAEREELQITVESLQSTMKSLERDQGDHVYKYQQEIRQLHSKLEETIRDRRSLQQEADDARFQLETQSEKLRLLTREREDLHSTLSSVKGSAKKAFGDHSEYLQKFKNEIQQLHDKLDDAHSEKLQVEKTADEIRFERDDLERRVKGLEEELAASRNNTLRLEGIRREEQETIRKMNAELRRRDSAKIDLDHFKNELERLKRHKDHLESLVAHRKVENSANLSELEEELAAAKRQIEQLQQELSAVNADLTESRNGNRALKEELRLVKDENSRQLVERNEALQRLQDSYDSLERLRNGDRDVIAKLNDELRMKESLTIDIEQLHHKFSRMKQDRDYLQEKIESHKNDYDRFMEEKDNEVAIYSSQVEKLEMELKKASSIDKKFRKDAEAQLESLQTNEANLIQNLRQRDTKIDQLENEVYSLREKEASSSQAETELIRLQGRLANLENVLEITTKEREEAVDKAKRESRSQKSVLNDLKQSRDEVQRCKNVMRDLNEELDNRQEECLKAKERIYQMESTLRAFKKEAKERVNTIVDRENDANSVLERTRMENRGLNNNLRDMNNIVERLRRERDICFQSLQDGQKKLSELSSRKDSLVHQDDLYSTPSTRYRSPRRGRESRPALRQKYPPVESITARVSNKGAPEIFVSSYQLGSPTTLGEQRAEDIAAAVALTAKDSLKENFEEVSQLRSQIYRLEDERSEQVASLRTKVSNLEKELNFERFGHKENTIQISDLTAKVRLLESQLSHERIKGNRTPLMGSSTRRLQKQNHFVDWDEKREY